jgi:PEP-CTERM/exosortase A-associated glycosyltransferase
MSLRVLHVLDHSVPLHSGYSFRTLAILEQQRAMGWETVHVTSPKHDVASAAEEDVDGLHFYRSPRVGRWPARVPAWNQLAVVQGLERRLREVVRDTHPHLLHAHSPALNGLAALRVARRCRLPLVYEVRAFWEDAAVDHGTTREGSVRYRLTRALESYVLRRADAVTCICQGLKRDIVARSVPEERVNVVPNAVDTRRFRFGLARDEVLLQRLGLAGSTVLGFVGSLYAYEGLDLAIEALPGIRRVNPNVRLLVVGGGPHEASLRRLVAAYGVEDAVVFAGRVPHDGVARYYNVVDILVYPRRSMRLTELVTPLKPLEGMAQGKLVLASDVGGHRELIRDGETGFLFRAGSAEALTETIGTMFHRPQHCETVRAAARRFVERERSWPATVRRYEEVYSHLTEHRHGTSAAA